MRTVVRQSGTGKWISLLAGIGAVGLGVWYYFKKKSEAEPTPENYLSQIEKCTVKTGLEAIRVKFEADYAAGTITKESYDKLFAAYIRRGYYIDLYARGGNWVQASNEYWAKTSGMTTDAELKAVYDEIYELYSADGGNGGGIPQTEVDQFVLRIKNATSLAGLDDVKADFTARYPPMTKAQYDYLYIVYYKRYYQYADFPWAAGIEYIANSKVAWQILWVWDHVAGCGWPEPGNKFVYVYRSAQWLAYDCRRVINSSWTPLDEIGELKVGDFVYLYVDSSCQLLYGGNTYNLTTGWNIITWK